MDGTLVSARDFERVVEERPDMQYAGMYVERVGRRGDMIVDTALERRRAGIWHAMNHSTVRRNVRPHRDGPSSVKFRTTRWSPRGGTAVRDSHEADIPTGWIPLNTAQPEVNMKFRVNTVGSVWLAKRDASAC